jgi:hypothetical protein
MAKKHAGILSLNMGGRSVSVGASLTYQPNTIMREGRQGQSGRGGYVEKPMIAWIEGELNNDDPEINAFLRDFEDEDVQLDLANGESYAYLGAWTAGEFTANGVEGTRSFRIESDNVEDLSS